MPPHICWDYVIIRRKNTKELNQSDSECVWNEIENWISEYTRYSVKKISHTESESRLIVEGGTQSEWIEIAKLELFKDSLIVPDIIIPLTECLA